MIVISPACTNGRVSLHSSHITEVVRAVGTERFGKACFDVFEQPLDVDHWALFRYNRDNSVKCVATASRAYNLAARDNINRFVGGCYSSDPLLAVRAKPLQSACVIKIEIGDIRDRQHRYCFNQTHVQERLSFFHCASSDLYQLSVFRGTGKRPFSPPNDTAQFSTLADFIVAAAVKHEGFDSWQSGLLAISSLIQLSNY